jgi:hypothetical protein
MYTMDGRGREASFSLCQERDPRSVNHYHEERTDALPSFGRPAYESEDVKVQDRWLILRGAATRAGLLRSPRPVRLRLG